MRLFHTKPGKSASLPNWVPSEKFMIILELVIFGLFCLTALLPYIESKMGVKVKREKTEFTSTYSNDEEQEVSSDEFFPSHGSCDYYFNGTMDGGIRFTMQLTINSDGQVYGSYSYSRGTGGASLSLNGHRDSDRSIYLEEHNAYGQLTGTFILYPNSDGSHITGTFTNQMTGRERSVTLNQR